MRFQTKQKHMIDFLFPVALFFVFALSALTVILLAARIYQSTTESSSLNYTARTSLSYINEKIHQNDCDGAVYLDEFDGCQALVMEQAHNNERYYTYIYIYGQELKGITASTQEYRRSWLLLKRSGRRRLVSPPVSACSQRAVL